MENTEQKSINALAVIPETENQQGIENHKKAAKYLRAAANNHLQAAKHYEDGNHEKAAISTISAYGNVSLATKEQRKVIRHQALNE